MVATFQETKMRIAPTLPLKAHVASGIDMTPLTKQALAKAYTNLTDAQLNKKAINLKLALCGVEVPGFLRAGKAPHSQATVYVTVGPKGDPNKATKFYVGFAGEVDLRGPFAVKLPSK